MSNTDRKKPVVGQASKTNAFLVSNRKASRKIHEGKAASKTKTDIRARLDVARARSALEAISDEQDAAFEAAARADPDNPPAEELFARRGRPRSENPKQPVTIRLDADVVSHFKKGGKGWQTRINEALRKYVK